MKAKPNHLFILDRFDPWNSFISKKIQCASKTHNYRKIVFCSHRLGQGKFLLKPKKRIDFLKKAIPQRIVPLHQIHTESFYESSTFLDLISNQAIAPFLLLDSEQLLSLIEAEDCSSIFNLTTLIIYPLPEHNLIKKLNILQNVNILWMDNNAEIDELSKLSIHNLKPGFLEKKTLDLYTKSEDCALLRVKKHQSKERYQHTLNVYRVIKSIYGVQPASIRKKLRLASIYHDIAKEFIDKKLIYIFQKYLNSSGELPHVKTLHGPVGAWYIQKRFLITDPDVILAIQNHTTPDRNPPIVTKMLFIADHLDPDKAQNYSEGDYEKLLNMAQEGHIEKVFSNLYQWEQTRHRSN